jgi:predicted outer membrane repeat protein
MDSFDNLARIFFIFSVLLVFLCPEPAFSDHITVGGNVSGTWASDTVFVTGDLLVPDGEMLLIEEGTSIIFNGVYDFKVDGSLQAYGVPENIIRFTMADTTGFGIDTISGGGWEGIRFDHNGPGNDSSIFVHCRFEFGKIVNPDPAIGNGGAISVAGYNNVRISHCIFSENFATYNGGAIYLDSANVMIEHSSFYRNRAGLSVAPYGYGGAICSDHSNPEIWWNIFEENSSTGVGGGLAVRFNDCNVYNNIFSGNSSALGGGLGVLHIDEIYHRIDNNLLVENSAVFFGGGVASLDASPYYINNTIAFNTAVYGGGFYCKDSVSPDFYNTIIWGNSAAVGSQGYLFEVYSQADFFNCDIQDGPMAFGGSGGGEAFLGAYEACIDENPQFMGNGDYPYALSDDSPCYDAGTADTTGFLLPYFDLAGNPRVSHAFIDMGAYEIVWVSVKDHADADGLIVWPNPTYGKFKIQRAKGKVELNSVQVYSLSGQLVGNWNPEPGTPNPEFDINYLPDGIYLIRIGLEDAVITKPIRKISR